LILRLNKIDFCANHFWQARRQPRKKNQRNNQPQVNRSQPVIFRWFNNRHSVFPLFVTSRAARWFFSYQKFLFGHILERPGIEIVGIFYGHLEYVTAQSARFLFIHPRQGGQMILRKNRPKYSPTIFLL
jgi:hypothetical protein